MNKMCGCLGCRNEADGKIPHNGRTVWTCEECAEDNGVELTYHE